MDGVLGLAERQGEEGAAALAQADAMAKVLTHAPAVRAARAAQAAEEAERIAAAKAAAAAAATGGKRSPKQKVKSASRAALLGVPQPGRPRRKDNSPGRGSPPAARAKSPAPGSSPPSAKSPPGAASTSPPGRSKSPPKS